MSKLFVRAALIGCAAAGAAVAQTPVLPTPTQPVPTQPVVVRVTSPAPGQTILKTFDIADLVAPPADTPLAKPGNDPAMASAAKVYTQVRAYEVLDAARKQTPEGVCGFNCTGMNTLDLTSDNKTLVVRNTPAVADKVGACVESMRQLRSAQVKVDMVVFSVPCGNEAMVKLFGDKSHAAISLTEFNQTLRGLKESGSLDILTRPTLMLVNKQTGFCQVGQQVPMLTNTTRGADGKDTMHLSYQPVGMCSRVTPELSADMKSVALALEFERTECVGGSLPPSINCQQSKANVVLADGGSMAVKLGTRAVEQKIEQKVPVVGDLPYMGRLFRNVGVSTEKMDVVAVVTATRVNDAVCPPVAITPPVAAIPPMMAPTALPMVQPTVVLTPTVARFAPFALPMTPAPCPVAMPTPVTSSAPVTFSTPVALPPPVQVIGTRGLERVGVDFTTLTTADTLPKAVTGVRMTAQPGTQLYRFTTGDVVAVTGGMGGVAASPATETCDATCSLMTAYKAACAAGNKDEATRLALKLLANDPTCFGKK